jgi:hypothetical protein
MSFKLEHETFQAVRMYVRNHAAMCGKDCKGAKEIRDRAGLWGSVCPRGLMPCMGEVCRWLLDARIDPSEVGLDRWRDWYRARMLHPYYRERDGENHPMSGWFAFYNGAVWFLDHEGFAQLIEGDEGDWNQALEAGVYTTRAGARLQAAQHDWAVSTP